MMSREGAGGFAGAGDGSRARSPTHPGIRSVAGAQITTVMGVNEPIGTGCVLKALLLPSPSLPSRAGFLRRCQPRTKSSSVSRWVRAEQTERRVGAAGGLGRPGTGFVLGKEGLDSGTWHHPAFIIAGKWFLLLTSGTAAPCSAGWAPRAGSAGDGHPHVSPTSAGSGIPCVGSGWHRSPPGSQKGPTALRPCQAGAGGGSAESLAPPHRLRLRAAFASRPRLLTTVNYQQSRELTKGLASNPNKHRGFQIGRGGCHRGQLWHRAPWSVLPFPEQGVIPGC